MNTDIVYDSNGDLIKDSKVYDSNSVMVKDSNGEQILVKILDSLSESRIIGYSDRRIGNRKILLACNYFDLVSQANCLMPIDRTLFEFNGRKVAMSIDYIDKSKALMPRDGKTLQKIIY